MFLDGGDSILSYYGELLDEKNKCGFLIAFNNVLKYYFRLLDDGLYQKNDFFPMSLTFNIYCILKAYHEHKDDIDTFNCIVEDCKKLIDCHFLYNNKTSKLFFLQEKKQFIDKLISFKYYSTAVRGVFLDTFNRLGYPVWEWKQNEVYSEAFRCCDKVCDDYVSLQKENINYQLGDIASIIDSYFNKVSDNKNSVYELYYDKSLLFGDRFKYLNDKIVQCIDNKDIRNDFMYKLSKIDYRFFQYLNSRNSDCDSFMTCLDIVFDSDSYYEVGKKLDLLIDFSSSRGMFELERVVEELNDIKNKDRVFGKVVSYQSGTINQVVKPMSIKKRMIDAYSSVIPNVDVKNIIMNVDSQKGMTFSDFSNRLMERVSSSLLNKDNLSDDENSIGTDTKKTFSDSKKENGDGAVVVSNRSGTPKEKKRSFLNVNF